METLVLNAQFQPVTRVTWQRAVTLLFLRKVELVDAYGDKTVRSVSVEVQVPATVRFLRSHFFRPKPVRLSRENLYARDRGRCQYCGGVVTRAEATWDHVVPRVQGGVSAWDNVVIACVRCNQKKGGRTPTQARMVLRTSPRRPAAQPDAVRLGFAWQPGMPEAWRTWVRDLAYWHGALEED